MVMTATRYRVNEDGETEKLCIRCGEWWPADKEFFYLAKYHGHDGLSYWCKACYLERRKELKQIREESKSVVSSMDQR